MKLGKIIKKLAIAFIVLNVLVFSFFIIEVDPFKHPYPQAKTKLAVAEGINWVYVIPVRGLLTPLTSLRDYLFDSGIHDIPAGDGEREIWWAHIYFAEYKTIHNPKLQIYLRDNGSSKGGEIPGLWLNQIYGHLMRLANVREFADPVIRNERLKFYTGEAMLYMRGEQDLYSRQSYNPLFNFQYTVEYQRPYFRNRQEMQRVENLLQGYLNMRQSILAHHPEEYEAFTRSDQYLKEPLFLYEASTMILAGKIINGNFTCQDPRIKILLDSQAALPQLNLRNGRRVYSLSEPPSKSSPEEDYTAIYYNLQRMEQAQFVGATLQKQCGLFKGATFKELKKIQDPKDPMRSPLR